MVAFATLSKLIIHLFLELCRYIANVMRDGDNEVSLSCLDTEKTSIAATSIVED